jgi:hypothetical protein
MIHITEDTEVKYDKWEDITYYDDGESDDVLLEVAGKIIGTIKVWCDSEMDGREYICINHTIVYLDTLTNTF